MVNVRAIIFIFAAVSMVVTGAFTAYGEQPDSSAKELIFLAKSLHEDTLSNPHEPFVSDQDVSETGIIARFMIRVYQTFVSSQQHNVCVFTPSCSHFGMESVDRFGFFKGVLMTADRLTRCNNFVSQGGYAFDQAAGKYFDPVAQHCDDSTPVVRCGTFCGVKTP